MGRGGQRGVAEVAERVGGREITRRITRGTLINYYRAPRNDPLPRNDISIVLPAD